ncbi:MAG TPA: hypothetical protein VJT32_02865 [bacterium]|nr:hypothetical protein [bacterium]
MTPATSKHTPVPVRLFSDRQRTDSGPGKHGEGTYEFLDRSARDNVGVVRSLLERWFSEYPTPYQVDLRKRFKTDFHAAFWELFLHAYCGANEFTLELHPKVPGSSKRPDFLVRKGDCEFYLEATVTRDESDEDEGRRRVRNMLYDAINSIESPNFFLTLEEFAIEPGKQPAARGLKAFLRRELPKHDPDVVASSLNSAAGAPRLEYRDKNVSVRISLMPRSPKARGNPEIRPIGIYPIQTHWGSGDEALRQSVNAKATRYGRLDRPYVVCVNYIGEWGVDSDDVLNALFGTEQLTATLGQPTPTLSRKRDGVFMGPAGPWNTRVSGVLVGAKLFPWSLRAASLELYHHPWGTKSLVDCLPMVRQARLIGDRLEWHDGLQLADLFHLPPNWPDV